MARLVMFFSERRALVGEEMVLLSVGFCFFKEKDL